MNGLKRLINYIKTKMHMVAQKHRYNRCMARGKKSGGHNAAGAPRQNVRANKSVRKEVSSQAKRLEIRSKESALYEQAVQVLERELLMIQPFGPAHAPDLIGRLEQELIGEYSRNAAPLTGFGVLDTDNLTSREPRIWSRVNRNDLNQVANDIMIKLQENPELELKDLLAKYDLAADDELWSRPVDGISKGQAIITPAGKNLGRKARELALYSQVELALAGVESQMGNTSIILESALSKTHASKIIRQAFKDTLGKRAGYKTIAESGSMISPF